MPKSQAYVEFDQNLGMVDALLRIEASYQLPLTLTVQKDIEGLRGGSAVLMVAAFENFLKELVEENLSEFTQIPLRFSITTLPEIMRLHNIEHIIRNTEESIKGKDRLTKIAAYKTASQTISSEVMTIYS